IVESKVTRSPSANPVTPAPTAAILPAASCPITIGGIRRPDDPSYPCTSLPQIPQAPTRISTSPAPAAGVGTSAISSDLYFDNNKALIFPFASCRNPQTRPYSNPFGVRRSLFTLSFEGPPLSPRKHPRKPLFVSTRTLRALCALPSVSSVLEPFSSLPTATNSSRKFQSSPKNFVSSYRRRLHL